MITTITQSGLIGIKPTRIAKMEDIIIIVGRTGKAVISGMTTRGLNWIKTNMTQESPITIEAESVEEIKQMIKADRLSISEK